MPCPSASWVTDAYRAIVVTRELDEFFCCYIGFGGGRPLLLVAHDLVAHDMGAPPALLYAADHPAEVAGLIDLDEPALTPDAMTQLFQFTPEHTKMGGLC